MESQDRGCNVSPCDRPHYARGMCNKHWQRWRRTGETGVTRREAPVGLSVPDRFRFYGWVESESGCWLWNGPVEPQGYGTLKVEGQTLKAHRVSYEVFKGLIPDNYAVLHSCDVRNCVNPSHLRVGTWADNATDRETRGRSGMAKLTAEDVKAIRSLHASGVSQAELGRRYNVSFQNVSRIVRRESWRHV